MRLKALNIVVYIQLMAPLELKSQGRRKLNLTKNQLIGETIADMVKKGH